ncbi:hypothetical protein NP233_g6749 [Leucocoprinus birnbaumii]|uniref:Uncharacterized protein n=1 Tax=Leucocoprinus birnbaumii TaxID=56174 RepID=A0AAD5VQJ9_9AGAR|nr:hypothetical protein NP233_g6749 [Leucocoprinus birnbaumii]
MGISTLETIAETVSICTSDDLEKALNKPIIAEHIDDDTKQAITSISTLYSKDAESDTAPSEDYPDGGLRAWAVVLGGSLFQLSSFGLLHQGVYDGIFTLSHFVFSQEDSTIGDIDTFSLHLFYGGAFITTMSLFLLSLVKPNQYYAVFLSQGLGIGIGGGLVYVPSLGIVSQYFSKRRAVAMPIVTAGVPIGASFSPIMLNRLLDRSDMSFGTVSRIYAALMLFILVLACVLIKPRTVPPKHHASITNCLGRFVKDGAYVTLTVALILFGLAVFFPLFFLQLAAVENGLGREFALQSLVILNGCGFFGRILCACVSGKIRVDALAIVSMAACGGVIFSFISIDSKSSIILVGVIYGFFLGTFVATLAPLTALLTDNMEEIGSSTDNLGLPYGVMAILYIGKSVTCEGSQTAFPVPIATAMQSTMSYSGGSHCSLSRANVSDTEKYTQNPQREITPRGDEKHSSTPESFLSRDCWHAPDATPDGGLKAWSVVFGAFLIQFCTARGRLYDRGYMVSLLYGGSFVMSISLFMLSLAKENQYAVVLVTQGICMGLGAGIASVPSFAIASQHFDKRRRTVLPLITMGVSVGATLSPILINNLLQRHNLPFQTVARIHAGIMTLFLIITCALVRPRLPPARNHASLSGCFKKFAKDKTYVMMTTGFTLFGFCQFYPLFFLQLEARNHGFNREFTFYTLVILNSCSSAGRFLSALTAHRTRIDWMTIGSATVCGSIVFAFFRIDSAVSVVLVGIIYGFAFGVFVATMAPLVNILTDSPAELGLRLGIAFAWTGGYFLLESLIPLTIDDFSQHRLWPSSWPTHHGCTSNGVPLVAPNCPNWGSAIDFRNLLRYC